MSKAKNRTVGSRFYFTAVVALIAGFICTGCQIKKQNHSFQARKEIAAENLLMAIGRELDRPEYAGIVSAIDYHPGNYPIPAAKLPNRISVNLLHEYIGQFERAGFLVRQEMVSPIMVCNELGYEMVKAWCNNDVQTYVINSGIAGNDCSGSGACYGAFGELARFCLLKENKTCSDIDEDLTRQEFTQSDE